jgi:SAM-dependent methyltransferase
MSSQCPLCNSTKFFTLKEYDINQLSKAWKNAFDLDPFNALMKENLQKRRCLECDLIFYSPSFFGDGRFYENLSQKMLNYYDDQRWEFDEALDLIAQYRPNSLLEFGCGTGAFLDKIRHAVDEITGIEINPYAIEVCQRKKIRVYQDLNQAETYDMIVFFEVLEHLENVRKILSDIINNLNKNGILLIAVPNPNSYLKDLDLPILDLPPHHSLGFSKNSLSWIGQSFELSEVHYAQEPIRYTHCLSYVESFNEMSYSLNQFKRKIQFSLFSNSQKILLPLIFPMIKASIIGQTHIIAFQKKG